MKTYKINKKEKNNSKEKNKKSKIKLLTVHESICCLCGPGDLAGSSPFGLPLHLQTVRTAFGMTLSRSPVWGFAYGRGKIPRKTTEEHRSLEV